MPHDTKITPRAVPVPLQLNGERLIASVVEGSLRDPESRPLFPDASEQSGRYYQTDHQESGTSITLHFSGSEALRAREVLARLLGEA